jgi:hypothetical protein
MNRFEDALRKALRREEPPDGFTERVMARLEAAPAPGLWQRLAAWFRPPVLRVAAFALIVLLLLTGAQYERQRRARQRAEYAREQAMLALRITFDKLEAVRELVNETAPVQPVRVVLPVRQPH